MRRFRFKSRDQKVSLFCVKNGLSNRLIPMGCALSLASELNYRPVVFWPYDGAISGASFGDLFETTNLPFELVEGFEAEIMRAALKGFVQGTSPLEKMVFRLFRSLMGVRLRVSTIGEEAKFRDTPALNLEPSNRYVIWTARRFRYGCDLSWLSPAPQLTSQIIELKKRFAPNTVGVHMRGTDRPGVPPMGKIILRMRAEIELDPDVKFFLASDGDRREEEIITRFKDRLIRPTKSAPRGTLEGQQCAVVDLFGLAATSRIIGRRSSSFPTLAALIGNKPLLMLKPE